MPGKAELRRLGLREAAFGTAWTLLALVALHAFV